MLHIAQNDQQRRYLICHQNLQEPVVTSAEVVDFVSAEYLANHPELNLADGHVDVAILSAMKQDPFLPMSYFQRIQSVFGELDESGVTDLPQDDGSPYYQALCRIVKATQHSLLDQNLVTRPQLAFRALPEIESGKLGWPSASDMVVHTPRLLKAYEKAVFKSLGWDGLPVIPYANGSEGSGDSTGPSGPEYGCLSLNRPQDPESELRQILGQIQHLKSQNPMAQIAVVISVPETANRYEKALKSIRISCRNHTSTSQIDKPEAKLLMTVLSARLHGLDLNKLASILLNPAQAKWKLGYGGVSNLLQALKKAGVGNELDDMANGRGNFREQLEGGDAHLGILDWIADLLSAIPDELDGLSLSDAEKLIQYLLKGMPEDKHPIREAHAVEILPASSAMWQVWNAVFVPGFNLGAYPKRFKNDELFSDKRRTWLNEIVSPNLMMDDAGLFGEADVETRVSNQYQDFKKLISHSASTHLYCPSGDGKGGILEESPYVEWLREDKCDLRVGVARDPISLPLDQLIKTYRLEEVDETPERGQISKERMYESFSHVIGTDPKKPLSPTGVELIATCRFKGFVERGLKIKLDREVGNDVDVMWLGTLAHAVLETFYRERISKRIINRFGKEDRDRLSVIFQATAQKHREHYLNPHPKVLDITLQWLKDVIMRLVRKLESDIAVDGVKPAFVEKKLGFGELEKMGPGHRGEDRSISFQWGKDRIYLRGIVDRVDVGPRARVVVDYKMSNAMAISEKVRSGNILTKHFQIPLYLWLLEQANPSESNVDLLGYLVSIKDAAISRIVGVKDADFREKLVNPEREDSLVNSMGRVISPLISGDIEFEPGPHCDFCQLAPACRKNDV